jgi:glycosyltransferase involved in cell wall biosynthesis
VESQSLPAREIWVVDDDSSDQTRELVPPHVNYLRTETQCGPAAARNRVIDKISADWMLPLDADDRLAPGALESFASHAASRADCLRGNIWEVQANRRKLIRYPTIPSSYDGIDFILRRPRIPFKHSACLFRVSTLRALGGYDESLPLKIDVDLIVRLLARGGTLEAVPEAVLEHFVHERQMSRQRIRGLRCYSRIIGKLEETRFVKARQFARRGLWEMSKALWGR